MVRIKWTPQAENDVEEIGKYIERDSPRYARITVQRLYHSVQRLKRFPLSGRVIPEFHNEQLREVLVDSYRVLYNVNEIFVIVFAVVHQRRDLLNVL